MVAPLNFGSLPKKPSEGGVKPLDFGAVAAPKAQPIIEQVKVVASPSRPTAPPLVFPSTSVQPKPAPKPKHTGPVQTRASFIDPSDVDVPCVMKLIETTHPTMYRDPERRMKMEVQVKQLLPLTINVVLVWGDKPLSFLAKQTSDVTSLVREISNMRAYELVDEAQKSLTASPTWLQRLKSEDPVMLYKPKLAVIRSNIQRWLSTADQLTTDTVRTETQMTTCMATFGCVLTFLGQIPDTSLELASSQRRMTLQQAAMQAQSLVLQVDQQRKSLYTLKNALDTFLDVTMPAYESAKATR